MKRVIRWVGLGVAAAAALTMVLADVAFAAPRQLLIVKFDFFSPTGISCSAAGQGADIQITRGLTGNPVLRVLGDARGAQIACTLPDGSHWRVVGNQTAPYTPSDATWLTVFVRPGKAAMGGLIEIGTRPFSTYDPKTFVPLD